IRMVAEHGGMSLNFAQHGVAIQNRHESVKHDNPPLCLGTLEVQGDSSIFQLGNFIAPSSKATRNVSRVGLHHRQSEPLPLDLPSAASNAQEPHRIAQWCGN